jgi:hypothetical protein
MSDAVRSVVMVVMSGMATATVVTHLAQIFGTSFHVYAVSVVVAILLVVAYLVRTEWGKFAGALRSSRGLAAVLAASGLLAALATLFFHTERSDDHLYIPNVVYYVAHPEQALSLLLHFVDFGGEPVSGFRPGAAMPFVLVQGAVAYLLDLHVLDVYHVLAPALFGFLHPLVWFFVLRCFGMSDRAAAFGAIALCFSLPVMGESERSFGSYGLSRFWHGKAIVMSLGLPLFIGLTIDFLRERSRGPWIRIFICAVAQVGLSTTTMLLFPLLSLLLAGAAAVAFPRPIREVIRIAILYGLAQCYVIIFAMVYLVFGAENLAIEAQINESWPTDFIGHARFVVLGAPQASLVLMVVSFVGTLFCVSGWPRRFVVVWFAVGGVLFLNPIVAPLLIEYVTTPNIYWRLFYILPFPLAIGLIAAVAAERFGIGLTPQGSLIGVAVIALLIAVHGVPESSSIFARGTRLAVPGYKIDESRRLIAAEIIRVAPPGTMLAPKDWSGLIPMLSPHHPQLVAVGNGFQSVMSAPEQSTRRAASQFLSGMRGQKLQGPGLPIALELIGSQPQLRSVVSRARVVERFKMGIQMARRGFTEHAIVDEWVVFWRPDAWRGRNPGRSR